QELFVYGRGCQPCKVWGTTLREVMLGQRASVYCAICQR
ncbi:DNA-formamidopyrimidine glycosylase, partial [Pseudomonas syringae pv. tagetis]